jgi:hypothetical protein
MCRRQWEGRKYNYFYFLPKYFFFFTEMHFPVPHNSVVWLSLVFINLLKALFPVSLGETSKPWQRGLAARKLRGIFARMSSFENGKYLSYFQWEDELLYVDSLTRGSSLHAVFDFRQSQASTLRALCSWWVLVSWRYVKVLLICCYSSTLTSSSRARSSWSAPTDCLHLLSKQETRERERESARAL